MKQNTIGENVQYTISNTQRKLRANKIKQLRAKTEGNLSVKAQHKGQDKHNISYRTNNN